MKNTKLDIRLIIEIVILIPALLVGVLSCSTPTPPPATTTIVPPVTASVQPGAPAPSLSPSPVASPSTSPPATPSASPAAAPSITPPAYTVNVSTKTGIGNYLVDSKGMTLYYWAKDVNGTSNATSAILATWPIFTASTVTVPSTLNTADFATAKRTDSQAQSTYQGWPLYYFANDKAPGDTLGDGIGGVWFLVKVPFYTVMLESRTDLGNFLVDPKGMTLYYNNKDSAGQSNVTGATLTAWPIFNAGTFILPSVLKSSDFATITRSDGKMQSTYKGFPIYYYANDTSPGLAAGNGIGGVWFIINTLNFPPTPTPTPASGGGGYSY
jgi:predicted lipoprotein with Yx(FWY)xxD motif